MDRHDKQGIKSNIHIVLTGPDGKIKDERTSESIRKEKEVKDGEKSSTTN